VKSNKHTFLVAIFADVLNHETFGDVAEEVSSIVGEQGLNLLINNAGISPRSTRINFVTAEAMAETFAVNATSPLMLTKALLPLLKAGASSDVDEDSDFCIKNAAIVNISSVLGSISNNMGDRSGGLYPYRCSKVKFIF
jgi:NAD(P)-dependent dehydrogenase (short-subunit alcohol dehydrogenase family)